MTSPSKTNVDLSSYSRGDFDPGSWIRRAAWYLTSLMFVESALPWPTVLKTSILRAFGTQLGKRVVLKPRLRIKFPWNLSVGDYSWLGEGVWIDNLAPVHIGNNVCLSQEACVMTGNHDRNSTSFDLRLSPVNIADGAWIGARALVCPGTKVERHSMLEAGAVAKGALEEAAIYAGNPAVRIGTRDFS